MSKPASNAKSTGGGGGKSAARSAPPRSAEASMLERGLTAFHAAHQATYKARWLKSLYPALCLQHPSVAVLNRHQPPRLLHAAREQLRQRGAKQWSRGIEGEVEAWRFEDDSSVADAAAAVDALSLSSAPADSDADPDLLPITHSRFLPPTPIDPNTSMLLPYYLMDGASVLAVDAMQVGGHHSVLDLCAAPGGKSVVVAQSLDLLDERLPAAPASTTSASSAATLAFTQPLATLHSNEPQATRRIRLQNVLTEYIPPQVRKNRTRVEVTSWDATKIALPVARYDRVLVDAPCSSDRHVLQSAKEIASWSTKRILQNAERQESLLLNALKSVKVGGVVVYATCSLSRRENDQVVAHVLDKIAKNKSNQARGSKERMHVQVLQIKLSSEKPQVQESAAASAASASAASSAPALARSDDDILYLPMGEATKFGWMVLPDQVLHSSVAAAVVDKDASTAAAASPAAAPAAVGHGFGPLYFCRLKRISGAAAGEAESEEESDEYSDSEDDAAEKKSEAKEDEAVEDNE